jgi:hypothetical protein
VVLADGVEDDLDCILELGDRGLHFLLEPGDRGVLGDKIHWSAAAASLESATGLFNRAGGLSRSLELEHCFAAIDSGSRRERKEGDGLDHRRRAKCPSGCLANSASLPGTTLSGKTLVPAIAVSRRPACALETRARCRGLQYISRDQPHMSVLHRLVRGGSPGGSGCKPRNCSSNQAQCACPTITCKKTAVDFSGHSGTF